MRRIFFFGGGGGILGNRASFFTNRCFISHEWISQEKHMDMFLGGRNAVKCGMSHRLHVKRNALKPIWFETLGQLTSRVANVHFWFFVGLFRLGQCYRRRLNLAFASQVAREALCNDLFVIPRAVCVGEALAKKRFSFLSNQMRRLQGPWKRANLAGKDEDPCCPEHCRQWFRNCASKLGDGELVVPWLCPVFCGNWF